MDLLIHHRPSGHRVLVHGGTVVLRSRLLQDLGLESTGIPDGPAVAFAGTRALVALTPEEPVEVALDLGPGVDLRSDFGTFLLEPISNAQAWSGPSWRQALELEDGLFALMLAVFAMVAIPFGFWAHGLERPEVRTEAVEYAERLAQVHLVSEPPPPVPAPEPAPEPEAEEATDHQAEAPAPQDDERQPEPASAPSKDAEPQREEPSSNADDGGRDASPPPARQARRRGMRALESSMGRVDTPALSQGTTGGVGGDRVGTRSVRHNGRPRGVSATSGGLSQGQQRSGSTTTQADPERRRLSMTDYLRSNRPALWSRLETWIDKHLRRSGCVELRDPDGTPLARLWRTRQRLESQELQALGSWPKRIDFFLLSTSCSPSISE